MSTYGRTRILLGLATAVLVAACDGTRATGGPGAPTATSGGAGTQAPGGGGTTQAPGGGATVDACSMLTTADIGAVTGHAVSRSVSGAQVGIFMAGCQWELIDDEAIVPPSIVLGIMTSGGRAYYDTYFAPFNDEQGNTPIDGLGDAAMDVGFGAVIVVSGDAFFNLQYLGSAEDGDHEAELARKVITHLGG